MDSTYKCLSGWARPLTTLIISMPLTSGIGKLSIREIKKDSLWVLSLFKEERGKLFFAKKGALRPFTKDVCGNRDIVLSLVLLEFFSKFLELLLSETLSLLFNALGLILSLLGGMGRRRFGNNSGSLGINKVSGGKKAEKRVGGSDFKRNKKRYQLELNEKRTSYDNTLTREGTWPR